MAACHLSGEWQERHGCRPVLCETVVDPFALKPRGRSAGGEVRARQGENDGELQERAGDHGRAPGGAGADAGCSLGRNCHLDVGEDPRSAEPATARKVVSAAITEAAHQMGQRGVHHNVNQHHPGWRPTDLRTLENNSLRKRRLTAKEMPLVHRPTAEFQA